MPDRLDSALAHLTAGIEMLRAHGIDVAPVTIGSAQRFWKLFFEAYGDESWPTLKAAASDAETHSDMRARVVEFGKQHPDEFGAIMAIQRARMDVIQRLAQISMRN